MGRPRYDELVVLALSFLTAFGIQERPRRMAQGVHRVFKYFSYCFSRTIEMSKPTSINAIPLNRSGSKTSPKIK